MKPHESGTKEKGNLEISFPRGLTGEPEGFSMPLTSMSLNLYAYQAPSPLTRVLRYLGECFLWARDLFSPLAGPILDSADDP